MPTSCTKNPLTYFEPDSKGRCSCDVCQKMFSAAKQIGEYSTKVRGQRFLDRVARIDELEVSVLATCKFPPDDWHDLIDTRPLLEGQDYHLYDRPDEQCHVVGCGGDCRELLEYPCNCTYCIEKWEEGLEPYG